MEDDAECLICTETFLSLIQEKGGCSAQCAIVGHMMRIGIDENLCDPYCCDYCIDNTKVKKVRKQLVDKL